MGADHFRVFCNRILESPNSHTIATVYIVWSTMIVHWQRAPHFSLNRTCAQLLNMNIHERVKNNYTKLEDKLFFSSSNPYEF